MEQESKKKIKLLIADNLLTVVSDEEEAYSMQLAEKVDADIKALCRCNRKSVKEAAISTALNYCDEAHKDKEAIEELKAQLADYLVEISRQKADYDALEKENRKLQEEIAVYRSRLKEEFPGRGITLPPSSTVFSVHQLPSALHRSVGGNAKPNGKKRS